jgi:hypothetical protein
MDDQLIWKVIVTNTEINHSLNHILKAQILTVRDPKKTIRNT